MSLARPGVGPVGYVNGVTWHDSSAHSRELGEELRKKRKAAGFGGADLAHRLGWSPSKVSRIESGQNGISEVDAAVYLAVCGVPPDEMARLLNLVRSGDDRTWLQERGTRLPDELRTLVYHEAKATSISCYEPMLVPGLLQTEDYARELFTFGRFVPADKIGMALEARMNRQAVVRRPDPPACVFYIHEIGLRSIVGGNRVMHEQMLHLVFLTSRPQHQIRVVPTSAGPHGVWGAMFMLMGFRHHGPVVFIEGATTSLFLEKPTDIQAYQGMLNRLDEVALDAEQSRLLLAQLASDFDEPEVDHA